MCVETKGKEKLSFEYCLLHDDEVVYVCFDEQFIENFVTVFIINIHVKIKKIIFLE